jgi:tRNA(Ile)-lysidine synthase
MVGCSGGADSLALVRAAVHVGREREITVGALVIDHQLQSGSATVAQSAADVARQLGADPVVVVAVDVAQGPGSGGLEAAARDARRSTFEDYAEANGISAVLLGHTLEDQAETVLLGLARGSGARSLSGMREVDGLYRRPLLALTRAQVRDTVSDLAIYEDPHNSNPDFARVRVRHHVLPTLESDLGPGVARALARTADMLRDDADALEALALAALATDDISIDDLLTLPRAIRTRVLRMLAKDAGCTVNDLTREHILAIDALLTNWHGQGPLNLPGNVNVERRHGRLNFYKT